MLRGRRLRRNERVLRPVHPNAGIAAGYRAKLEALIERMCEDVTAAIERAYRRNPPEFAQDQERAVLTRAQLDRLMSLYVGEDPLLPGLQEPVYELQALGLIRPTADGFWALTEAGNALADELATPAVRLEVTVRRMRDRWLANFDKAAPRLAKYFSTAVEKRSSSNLRRILRDGGYSVKFQMTDTMRDVLDATIAENVGLIRTIPQQYLGQVQGFVMRSIKTGRDLSTVSQELRKRYGLTKKRAALIARDQNNKATSAMSHARQADLGIKENIWQHSRAGKKPRVQHVEMNGKTYSVTKGMWDRVEKKWVFPGELINCKCTSRPVIPGFT